MTNQAFSLTAENLLYAMGLLSSLRKSRIDVPMLSNTRIDVVDGVAWFTAGNGDSYLSVPVPTESSTGDFSTSMPSAMYALFGAIVQDDDVVSFAVDDTQLEVVSSTYNTTRLNTVDPLLLPERLTFSDNWLELPAESFGVAVGTVLPAVPKEMARPNIFGVHMFAKGGLPYVEATDGFRAIRAGVVSNTELSFNDFVLAPSVAAEIVSIAKHCETIKLSTNGVMVEVLTDSGAIYHGSTMAANFPPLDKIFAMVDPTLSISVQRIAAARAVQAVRSINGVKMVLFLQDDKLRITSKGDGGDVNIALDIYQFQQSEFNGVVLSTAYLSDVLKTFSDGIRVETGGTNNVAVLFSDSLTQHAVMPIFTPQ